MRKLVRAEPHRADLQRDLSVSLNNLGQLARAAGRSDEARTFFQDSLDVRRKLVRAEPHRADLLVDLAIGLWNLACLKTPPEETPLREAHGITTKLREAQLAHRQLEELHDILSRAMRRLES